MRKLMVVLLVLMIVASTAFVYATQPETASSQGVVCVGDRLSPDVIAQIYATHPDAGEPWFFVWDVCPN